ncbi:MAG: proliferating cell nuclear antigen (pcna) [Candidatus Aenigmatarchaeota archaeon]
MFKATISDRGLLVDSIATIAELIDEGIFKITKQGISLIAADRAMVAVVDFKLSASAFDTFELDKEENIGVNISNLLSILKRAGADDKITLNLQDSSKLEIVFKNSSRRKFVLPLIDLAQEEVPPIDQLTEFTANVELRSEILESGIEDAEIIADALLFEATGNRFAMRAEGDISKTELELEKGEEPLLDLKTDGSVRARYPLDYLKKMVKATKIADTVKLQFGQDYPMKLEFKSGDKISLTFVLAPRVSEE